MAKRAVADGADGWDQYAPFYDWENAQTVARRDVAFWERLAAAQDAPVLELGCGTGRLTVPIAKTGAAIVGIDRSPDMLARGRARLRRTRPPQPVRLLRGDIRALPFRSGAFAMVMAPYGMLQSLTREADLRATLEAVHRVLRPGGTFGIDLVPDLPRWPEYRQKRSLHGSHGRASTFTLVESVRQDAPRGLTIFDQEYIVRRAGRRSVHRFSLTFRTLSVPQMRRRLEAAGFEVGAVLGDYRGGPWDARSDTWVILATRRESGG